MKRAPREWPRSIVEVPARGPDPRSEDPRSEDPQATQKISREMLDAVLKGTKSGFRPAVRSKPDLTDAPDARDARDAPAAPDVPDAPAAPNAAPPRAECFDAPRRDVMTTRLFITRRMAFIAGVVVVVVMTVAALVGFFAGRLH